MNKLLSTLTIASILASLNPLNSLAAESVSIAEERIADSARLDWWLDDKFGMFIHWGPSSLAGVEISWARATHPYDHPGKLEKISDAEYDVLYENFNPVEFDADALVRTAKAAGMKYIVFTAKHHDGFCNWATELTDYNIMNTPYQRDICKELADAVHRHGLKLGWYYSTRDWTHPDYLVGDNSAYNDYYHGQLRELLTNYGDVDVLWFDHVSGRWDQYRFQELFDMIYELQPDIIINNRAARFVFRSKAGTPDPELVELTKGDYETPEGKIGVFRKDDPWETCMPMSHGVDGGGWSYRPDATTQSFEECAKMLSACVTGCGNMLLNVGPMSTGELRPEELENLKQFKPWIETYGESIYGTEGGPYISGQWGGSCTKDNVIYLHVFQWLNDELALPALPREVIRCEELGGEPVSFEQTERGLVLSLEGGKERTVHSVVKLTLADGPELALIKVEDGAPKKQHDTLVNPMAGKKK
ncbi:alpha-L-fucosidase [Pontiellaceae bacterium B1224]|nr:alpha-L-fucosidase [Pontiellaceae bacterium B1224]